MQRLPPGWTGRTQTRTETWHSLVECSKAGTNSAFVGGISSSERPFLETKKAGAFGLRVGSVRPRLADVAL